MDLNARQTRRLVLAGTVALPTPFPSTGIISFEAGSLTYASGRAPVATPFVVIQERARGNRSLTRATRQRDVAALFVPGVWRADGTFRISRRRWVNDLERGEWFLTDDVHAGEVDGRLQLRGADITTRDSILRGIAFIRKSRPVVSVTEVISTASEIIEWEEQYCTCSYCTCSRCTCSRCTCSRAPHVHKAFFRCTCARDPLK
jgi:hypothetical protein